MTGVVIGMSRSASLIARISDYVNISNLGFNNTNKLQEAGLY